MAGYVARSFEEVRDMLEGQMGFTQVNIAGCFEVVWQRQVVRKGEPTKYFVRVYSSVDKDTGWTRDCAKDAIRVQLVAIEDGQKKLLMKGKRVHRTVSALDNLRERARTLYGKCLDSACLCPKCNAVMAERTVKATGKTFLGCTDYPLCKGTREVAQKTPATTGRHRGDAEAHYIESQQV